MSGPGIGRAPVVSDVSYPSCSLEDLAMRTYDFSPLFRSTIGFDRLFDLAETAQRATEESYPPYNIERLADDRYQISLALAGSRLTRFRSPPSRMSSPSRAARPKRPSASSFTGVSRPGNSNGNSVWRIMSR